MRLSIPRRQFYQAIWHTTTMTVCEIYSKFCTEHPGNYPSLGTFFALKPSYVHHASQKDLIMRCCKIHLHVKWAIAALIKCMSDQGLCFPAVDFNNFLMFYILTVLMKNTHIPFECTPDKHHFCEDISSNWKKILDATSYADESTTMLFTEFKKEPSFNAKGEPLLDKNANIKMKLIPVKSHVNVKYLEEFLGNLLPQFIHHRNMLRLYRNTIKEFNLMFDNVHLDIDFSENLTLDIKEEPQSLHWVKQ